MQVVVEFPGAQMYRSMCSPLFTPVWHCFAFSGWKWGVQSSLSTLEVPGCTWWGGSFSLKTARSCTHSSKTNLLDIHSKALPFPLPSHFWWYCSFSQGRNILVSWGYPSVGEGFERSSLTYSAVKSLVVIGIACFDGGEWKYQYISHIIDIYIYKYSYLYVLYICIYYVHMH